MRMILYLVTTTLVTALLSVSAAASDTISCDTLELGQNYPNPFDGRGTHISFCIPGTSTHESDSVYVELRVYAVTGQEVCCLFQGKARSGEHKVFWDGRHKDGRTMCDGIYFYRIVVDKEVKDTKKMVMLH